MMRVRRGSAPRGAGWGKAVVGRRELLSRRFDTRVRLALKGGEEIEAVPLFVVVSERKLIYMIILTSAAARYSGAPSDQTYLPEFDLIDSVAAAAKD